MLRNLITQQTEGAAMEPGSDSDASEDRKAETWYGEEDPAVPGRGPTKVKSGTAFSAEYNKAVTHSFKQREEQLEVNAESRGSPGGVGSVRPSTVVSSKHLCGQISVGHLERVGA